MIELLTGKPHISPTGLIILVGGVGYGVYVGASHLAELSYDTTIEVTLHIYTHVREDALELFGFRTSEERALFLLLLSVSGVGPKTAVLITDRGATAITHAVQQADVTFFSSLPRIGKKLAQKIIIELKTKLGSLKELQIGARSEHEQTIVDAAVALGFSEQQVLEVLQENDCSELTIAAAIKLVLQKLS